MADIIELLSDDEDYLNHLYRPKINRLIRSRRDHFEFWNDAEFFTRFRLSEQTVKFILFRIEEDIITPTQRNNAVSPAIMLLLTLRLFATGYMLVVVGDFCGIHKSTASKIVHKVPRELAHLGRDVITFPQTEDEIKNTRQAFYNISKFPGYIGAIDCTHIRIKSPGGEDAELYGNRKDYFSINVQTICNAQLQIQNVVARWPGSTHDSTILNNSNVRAMFENGQMGDSLLVGDSGYPIKNYLITPLAHTTTAAENLFNEAQIRTRNPIERSYGVWKRRFPTLAIGINFKLHKVEAVIVATAVLHNIACTIREQVPSVNADIEAQIEFVNNFNPINAAPLAPNHANNSTRYALIHEHFQRLVQ